MVKFSKFCSESFTALPIDVVVFKCRKKIIRREIGETVRYSHYKKKTKIRLPLKLALLRISRSKYAKGQPSTLGSQYSKCHFRRIIAERVKAVLLAHIVFQNF